LREVGLQAEGAANDVAAARATVMR